VILDFRFWILEQGGRKGLPGPERQSEVSCKYNAALGGLGGIAKRSNGFVLEKKGFFEDCWPE
jgi:hypothetical protein